MYFGKKALFSILVSIQVALYRKASQPYFGVLQMTNPFVGEASHI
jgi:hypothetical protein